MKHYFQFFVLLFWRDSAWDSKAAVTMTVIVPLTIMCPSLQVKVTKFSLNQE